MFALFFKESGQVESPRSEDSSSNADESQGTDGDAQEEKGEEVQREVGKKHFSPIEGKHNDMDVDNDGDDEDEDDDNGQEEGEMEEDEEDGKEEDMEETEGGIQKKHKGENFKQSRLGDETAEGKQEGQAMADQQQKNKVFQTTLYVIVCII